MRAAGIDAPETVEANAIGFLFQAYEATAGLIGNTLVTLQRQPDLRAQLANAPARVEQIVAQVAVADPAIQNTRRHVAEDGIIAGQPMHTGETIQVILAEANHDPAAQAQPIRLDAARAGRRGYSFGAGPHACPGVALAQTIARASIAAILAYRDDRWLIPEPPGYLSSVNARVPAFTEEFP